MLHGFAFFLLATSLGAFFVPLLCRTIRFPTLVGEIIFGILLRFALYDVQVNTEMVDFLAEVGFIFLMFLVGMEIDFDRLSKGALRSPLLMVAIFYGAALLLYQNGLLKNFFMIILVTATSVGVAFIALKTHADEKTTYGQKLIWVASIGELATILMMIIFEITMHSQGSINTEAALQIAGLFALMTAAYIFIRLILAFLWHFPAGAHLLEADTSSEMGVRLAILVLLMMVSLSSLFGLELILGSFLGGMMLSFVFRDKETLESKLSSVGHGIFIPFFFIKIGWDFAGGDLSGLADTAVYAVALYGLILATRLPAALLLMKSRREIGIVERFKKAISATVLWAAPLTLLVALAQLGKRLGVVDDVMHRGIVLCAMLGAVAAPIAYGMFRPSIDREGAG